MAHERQLPAPPLAPAWRGALALASALVVACMHGCVAGPHPLPPGDDRASDGMIDVGNGAGSEAVDGGVLAAAGSGAFSGAAGSGGGAAGVSAADAGTCARDRGDAMDGDAATEGAACALQDDDAGATHAP